MLSVSAIKTTVLAACLLIIGACLGFFLSTRSFNTSKQLLQLQPHLSRYSNEQHSQQQFTSGQALWAMNARVESAGPYRAPHILSSSSVSASLSGGHCPITVNRTQIFRMMKQWSEFAARHNILWFVKAGSLLGVLRYRDVIPWDIDADIVVFASDETKLRGARTRRGHLSRRALNIIVRPTFYDGDIRRDCSGRVVTSQTDQCAFTGPLARLVSFDLTTRIDIFIYHIEPPTQTNKLSPLAGRRSGDVVVKTALGEYDGKSFPLDMLLPLRSCSLMTLKVFCPRDSAAYLARLYGRVDIVQKPDHMCVALRWKKISL